MAKDETTIPPLPPMNGTLAKLYNLASLPVEELRKPTKQAEAIRELALVIVYIYTETADMKVKVQSILQMVQAISNRSHNERKEDIAIARKAAEEAVKDHKDTFANVVVWFRDKVLPTIVIGIILMFFQMLAWFYISKGIQ